jgi:tyrosinase
MFTIDAPDFYESSFWKDSDPLSGLGGWGDLNADFSVVDGGFRSLSLSYPSPHILRRNFTLRPWDFDSPLLKDRKKMANTSLSTDVVKTLLETSPGHYEAFQVALEAFEVRALMRVNVSRYPNQHLLQHQGLHSAVHFIMGG